MIAREKGEGKAEEASEEIIFKIDVPANRSELLSFFSKIQIWFDNKLQKLQKIAKLYNS